ADMRWTALERLPVLAGVIKEALRCVLPFLPTSSTTGRKIDPEQTQPWRAWTATSCSAHGRGNIQWGVPATRNGGKHECSRHVSVLRHPLPRDAISRFPGDDTIPAGTTTQISFPPLASLILTAGSSTPRTALRPNRFARGSDT